MLPVPSSPLSPPAHGCRLLGGTCVLTEEIWFGFPNQDLLLGDPGCAWKALEWDRRQRGALGLVAVSGWVHMGVF